MTRDITKTRIVWSSLFSILEVRNRVMGHRLDARVDARPDVRMDEDSSNGFKVSQRGQKGKARAMARSQ